MAAFINTPLRKIKSDPLLLNKLTPIRISKSDTNLLQMAMMPISPKSIKKELMAMEFQYNMQLKAMETQGISNRERTKEDRKDKRTKLQATQQSEMIDQRKTGKPPKNFESMSDNNPLGRFDLGSMKS